MRKSLFLAFFSAILFMGYGCNKVAGTGEVTMKNSVDSLSYALGYMEGSQFKKMMEHLPFDTVDIKKMANALASTKIKDSYVENRTDQFGDLNVEMFKTAFLNEVAYGKSYFDEMTADICLRTNFDKMNEQKAAEAKKSSAGAAQEGKEFLAENAKREEVTVLESGLQYEVLKQGNGPKPTASSQIKCHYHGTLINGEVFDSSVDRGEPAVFGVGQVIKGWTEALQLMPVGSKWKLYIPSDLAYGDNGAGGKIGPGATLIFEVELLEIVK